MLSKSSGDRQFCYSPVIHENPQNFPINLFLVWFLKVALSLWRMGPRKMGWEYRQQTHREGPAEFQGRDGVGLDQSALW